VKKNQIKPPDIDIPYPSTHPPTNPELQRTEEEISRHPGVKLLPTKCMTSPKITILYFFSFFGKYNTIQFCLLLHFSPRRWPCFAVSLDLALRYVTLLLMRRWRHVFATLARSQFPARCPNRTQHHLGEKCPPLPLLQFWIQPDQSLTGSCLVLHLLLSNKTQPKNQLHLCLCPG